MANFLKPSGHPVIPRRLDLPGFIQFLLVGLSGIRGELVRERAQPDPPKQPPIDVNWIAYEVASTEADFNPYLYVDSLGTTQFQRHVTLSIATTFYGPDALPISDMLRDGFEIQQNRYWLAQARMGFLEVGAATRVPDLVNDRWVNRYERTIKLRHQLLRSYPVPAFGSVNGVIHTDTNPDLVHSWQNS